VKAVRCEKIGELGHDSEPNFINLLFVYVYVHCTYVCV
jgi:hypothetical protein